jgi:hypothetical protein
MATKREMQIVGLLLVAIVAVIAWTIWRIG